MPLFGAGANFVNISSSAPKPLFDPDGSLSSRLDRINSTETNQQTTAVQSDNKTETNNSDQKQKVDLRRPRNLKEISDKLISAPDDESFLKGLTPERATRNVEIMRSRFKEAGISDEETDRWLVNMDIEGQGFQNKRESYSTLGKFHQGKTIAEKRQFYFDNKHLYYYTEGKSGRIVERIPEDGKIPAGGKRFPGGQIDGGGRYYGRTPLQITHRHTYKKIGDAIGVDLENNPDLIFDDKVWPEAVLAFREMKMKEGHKFDSDEGVIKAIAPHDKARRMAEIARRRASKK